jgi:hypothetical protein
MLPPTAIPARLLTPEMMVNPISPTAMPTVLDMPVGVFCPEVVVPVGVSVPTGVSC